MNYIYEIANFLWSYVIAYLLLGVGLLFTISLGVPQLKYFSKGIKLMKTSMKSSEGGISGFAALCSAVGGQVGTGSLVGVASALASGGPGAIFWMWVTALFGMVISFSEVILGQLFRVKTEDGTYRGGAAYYIEKGLNKKWLAILISILYVLGIGMAIASMQTHSIANAFSSLVDINPIIPGIIVIALTAFVIIGGARRLADVSSLMVPFMAMAYILLVLFIVITNISLLPSMFILIIKSAFTPQAAAGGIIGHTVMQAFRNGTARGLFSNDAGNGFIATMHATADIKHPVEQGFLGMIGTFITTCIICSMTAFAILFTGALSSNAEGINLLQEAFYNAIGTSGRWIVFFAMFLFGFTTLLADIFVGETNIAYVFKEKSKTPIWIYRIILLIILLVSCTVPLNAVWAAIDTLVGLILFINLFALLKLYKYIKFSLQNYIYQLKSGIEQPLFNRDIDIKNIDLNDYTTFKSIINK